MNRLRLVHKKIRTDFGPVHAHVDVTRGGLAIGLRFSVHQKLENGEDGKEKTAIYKLLKQVEDGVTDLLVHVAYIDDAKVDPEMPE